jgi:hypothetical protein
LTIEIKLSGPPRGGTIFKLQPIAGEVVASALSSKIREVFHLEAARLLKIVIVGYKVGAFLGITSDRKGRKCKQ